MSLSVVNYGTVGQNQVGGFANVNDAPAFQSAINACSSLQETTLIIPKGYYNLQSQIVVNAPIHFVGEGYLESGSFNGNVIPGGYSETATGTWLQVQSGGYTGFRISGGYGREVVFQNIGFTQYHPSTSFGPGWVPNNYDYAFDIQNNYGAVIFDEVVFLAINKGIRLRNSGRLHIKKLTSQIFNNLLDYDNAMDISVINFVHNYPYWSQNSYVIAYQQNNLDLIKVGRADGFHIIHLFSLGGNSTILFMPSSYGVTTDFSCDYGYSDLTRFGIIVLAPARAVFGKWKSECGDILNPGNPLANSSGILVDTTGAGSDLSFAALQTDRCINSGVRNLAVSGISIDRWAASYFVAASQALWQSPNARITLLTREFTDGSVMGGSEYEMVRFLNSRDTPLGIYADDAAAAADGIAIGLMYRRSDGLMVWRKV